ncbi:Radical S-adenosyl methionine domain-containing protein 2 [Pseudolycoriella hygida]|uniref:Radical S-adenosyl methionine domain-containing protein 2 n=1 Tax=Pseudolycoriella hygida TaxID=35572 RepID=A0A9Q0NCE0_9DIPT|nr:Radical S-adenosyl methionine domain-containing protein 2 [Pseudolycoriella hygida]
MEIQEIIRRFVQYLWIILSYFYINGRRKPKIVPVSVNYHFTRKCNYSCGFCFHTAKTSYVAPMGDIRPALRILKEKGMKKINLSGGEPFLYPELLGEICKYCKKDLKLESVSIVTNGSKVKESFFRKYGKFVDIIAVSVDSFNEETNIKIGRGAGNHLRQLNLVSKWCESYNIKFKLNTVVNRFNHSEDMSQNIAVLNSFRWKCFQVLPVDTENIGGTAIRNCSEFLISNEEFRQFCKRHQHLSCFVPESNILMKSSYIILDEYLRFLSKGNVYKESTSILLARDVDSLLQSTDFEHNMFVERGGVYDWSKDSSCNTLAENLKW